MKRRLVPLALAVLFGLTARASAQQPAAATPDGSIIVHASALTWSPLELPGFASGVSIAVVQGDPSKEGEYTLRLRFPDAYVFPAHYHPNAENLTVLSGKFLLGHGARAEASGLKAYAPGDYLFIPGTMPHYGQVQGETIVQLHGMGPFEVKLADPTAGSNK